MSIALRILAALVLLAGKEDRFAEDMLRRLRDAMPGQTLRLVDADTIVVEGGDQQMFLARLRQNCRNASAKECDAHKRAYVQAMTERQLVTPESLRVMVRDEKWVSGALDGAVAANHRLILRSLGDDLYAVLASERTSSIATVPRAQLAELGLEVRTAWALARKQTEATLPALPSAEQLRRGPVVIADHEFGASLLARAAAWRRLSTAVGPDLIVTVVSDHLVLIGIKADGTDLDAFKTIVADDCREQERCISPHVYRYRDGRWVIAR